MRGGQPRCGGGAGRRGWVVPTAATPTPPPASLQAVVPSYACPLHQQLTSPTAPSFVTQVHLLAMHNRS